MVSLHLTSWIDCWKMRLYDKRNQFYHWPNDRNSARLALSAVIVSNEGVNCAVQGKYSTYQVLPPLNSKLTKQ